MNTLFQKRFGWAYLFFILFVSFSALVRAALLVRTSANVDFGFVLLLKIFSIGLIYDLITASYFAIPFIVYLLLLPDKIYNKRYHAPLVYLVFLAIIYSLLFNAVAEWLFWDEFGTRFNFIAVDYLIYTHEVVGNIRESYPVNAILAVLLVISLLVLVLIKNKLRLTLSANSTFTQRLRPATIFLSMPILAFLFVDISLTNISHNRYANELSGNGIYDFFSAFRNNELDYASFYRTEKNQVALTNLRTLLQEPNAKFVNNDMADITRQIQHSEKEIHLNVVLITVESLSAEYLGVFGNREGLTPNLDKLAQQSMLFTNLYATGTRTVRGLEAITLSVPPTPGQSIVKRPHNEGLFSLGYVFKAKGYDTRFIYGGYGYFDNMNYFFANNGFDIVDRTSMAASEIHFANVWGVADEDLFSRAVKEMDQSYANGKPFFHLIMTTSNHRPFTYPEGRIDIPSHTGRSGGVKYTDFAIGQLIAQARGKPWFNNTLFVVIADHCASSAGKSQLPVNRYKIPLIIYAPQHIKPQVIDRLTSQIDFAPTLLGLLNFGYRSKFFGYDILRLPAGRERAFISNYQEIGYIKDGTLTVLSPKRGLAAYSVNFNNGDAVKIPPVAADVANAISYYQGASYLFQNRLNLWQP